MEDICEGKECKYLHTEDVFCFTNIPSSTKTSECSEGSNLMISVTREEIQLSNSESDKFQEGKYNFVEENEIIRPNKVTYELANHFDYETASSKQKRQTPEGLIIIESNDSEVQPITDKSSSLVKSTNEEKQRINYENVKFEKDKCAVKEENEITNSNEVTYEYANKFECEINGSKQEDKRSQMGLRITELKGTESQPEVNESTSLGELIEANDSLNFTKKLTSGVKLKRRSDSLALISSIYDNSDSGSDCQSLANGFSDNHSDECFSSDSDNSESDNDTEGSESDLESIIAKKPTFIPKQLKVRGELGIKDLPPIEDLHISVKEEECIPFGKVYSIVDTLLVIQSLPDKPALNLDSIFFRHNGTPVGRIFDVFGPVKRPFYSVRFNRNSEIREKGLEIDVVLYAAPKTKHTDYVFANQLLKQKGSDASWLNDCEPPEDCIDYSDDEEERNNRMKQKKPLSIKQEKIEEGSPARKKYLTFEERMNRNNMMRNKYYSKMSSPSFKRSWDVGWHNRIDRRLSSPSPHPLPSNNTNNGVFQMRPPLFIPPPPTSGPSMMRHSFNVPFSPPPPLSQHNHSALPLFNPHLPPPNWPSSSQQFGPLQTFPAPSTTIQPNSVHLNKQMCPPIPNLPTPSAHMFYRCRPPPVARQQSIMNSQFSSPSSANNFFQFPQYSSRGNSF